MIAANAIDRLQNIGDNGESYEFSDAKFHGNVVEYDVILRPFNNRSGHLYVEFSMYVDYDYPEEYYEEQECVQFGHSTSIVGYSADDFIKITKFLN